MREVIEFITLLRLSIRTTERLYLSRLIIYLRYCVTRVRIYLKRDRAVRKSRVIKTFFFFKADIQKAR